MSERIRIVVGNKVLMVDRDWNISRNVCQYVIGGVPQRYYPGHSLSPAETAEAFAQFERERDKQDHAWASVLKENPRFKAALRKAEEEEDFETLEHWNNDPTALRENFTKYLDGAKSPAELKEMKRARKEADKLEEKIMGAGHTNLRDLAQVMTTKGKKAFKPKPKPKTEDEETLGYYDDAVRDATKERDNYRREMLEQKAQSKEGMSTAEVSELMSLRRSTPAPEDSEDE